MPDQPLPNDPRFGFFDERPDQRLSDDENQLDCYPDDEANPVRPASLVYPTRDNDFEMREIERLMGQLDAVRIAYHAAYKALVTDNPWRVAEVRDALREIGAALGLE